MRDHLLLDTRAPSHCTPHPRSTLTIALYENEANYAEIQRYRKIISETPIFNAFDDYFLSREERYAQWCR